MQPGDREVIACFLRGDADAVGTIDAWILQSARGYRRSLAAEWDDVLQEIRLEVLRLLRNGQFRGEANLKTYLWRVVSHSCLDRIRARKKWQWAELDEAPEVQALAVERSAQRVGWGEAKDLLLRILEAMPDDCRQLWSMVLEGMSYREMSKKVGVSEGTLRVRVMRCRKRAVEIRREFSRQAAY